MKITKRQLRRIIREEKTRLLSEAYPSAYGKSDLTDLDLFVLDLQKGKTSYTPEEIKGAFQDALTGALYDTIASMKGEVDFATLKQWIKEVALEYGQ